MDTGQKLEELKKQLKKKLRVKFAHKVWAWWKIIRFIYNNPMGIYEHLVVDYNKRCKHPLAEIIWKELTQKGMKSKRAFSLINSFKTIFSRENFGKEAAKEHIRNVKRGEK